MGHRVCGAARKVLHRPDGLVGRAPPRPHAHPRHRSPGHCQVSHRTAAAAVPARRRVAIACPGRFSLSAAPTRMHMQVSSLCHWCQQAADRAVVSPSAWPFSGPCAAELDAPACPSASGPCAGRTCCCCCGTVSSTTYCCHACCRCCRCCCLPGRAALLFLWLLLAASAFRCACP
jgi:hypothetical protein